MNPSLRTDRLVNPVGVDEKVTIRVHVFDG